MPTYKYRAVSDRGTIVQNRIEEINRKAVIKKLRRNNLTPINIVQVNSSIFAKKTKKQKKNAPNVINNNILEGTNKNEYDKKSLSKRLGINITHRISHRDLVIFTQNLYLLKKANFNNIHALSTIIENTENEQFKEILNDILAGVESGENMYTTMEYYSEVFPYLYINMIKVGEQSGSLTKSLQEAVEYLDETQKFSKKIKGILIPNIIMLIGILIILIVGTIIIVPIIQNLFDSMGSTETLPKITLWFSGFVNLLIKYWYVPLIIILGIVGYIIAYINSPKGRYNFDYLKYRIPLFGKLIFSIDFMRFARAMLLNLNNGIRIQNALETSKNVVKNVVLRSIIETSINDLILGQSWVDAFERSNLASPMEIEMLNIGMRTDIKEMMEKLIEYLQIDINNMLAKVVKVLPEIVYTIVGVALIFLVVVILVPCINVYMGGWLFSAAGIE